MTAVRLPVLGIDVALRPPAGADDVRLLEAGAPDMAAALALLAGVARTLDGAPLDPAALPISDVDALLLRLHQRTVGDTVNVEDHCPAAGCRAHVDITFSIAAYLEHHRPQLPPDVAAAVDGWYRLAGEAIEFRLPRAADHVAIARAADPERALLERCARPIELAEPARPRIERAMEAMAPSLHGALEGTCPSCGVTVEADFDPLHHTLRALRRQAAYVYDEVCSIAHHYHWSEAEILALPTARRARYAELAAHRTANQRPIA